MRGGGGGGLLFASAAAAVLGRLLPPPSCVPLPPRYFLLADLPGSAPETPHRDLREPLTFISSGPKKHAHAGKEATWHGDAHGQETAGKTVHLAGGRVVVVDDEGNVTRSEAPKLNPHIDGAYVAKASRADRRVDLFGASS